MKTRGVIGKRIVAIRQAIRREAMRPQTQNVFEIELENGWLLRPIVSELDNDYAVDFVICKPRKR